MFVCLLPPSEPNFIAIIPDEQAIILKCGMYLRIKKQILRENWKGIETTICNNKNCVAMVTEYSSVGVNTTKLASNSLVMS